MKVTIKGFIHQDLGHIGDAQYDFFPFEMETQYRVIVMKHEFDVEIPDNFDPTARQIEILNKEKKKIQDDYWAKIKQIDNSIANLQSLTYETKESTK